MSTDLLSASPPGCLPHDYAEYAVCRKCGRTEAAIEGCHHCDESQSSGRCWWCLTLQANAPALTAEELAARDRWQKIRTEFGGGRMRMLYPDVNAACLLADAVERLAQENARLREELARSGGTQ